MPDLPRRIVNPVTGDIIHFIASPMLGDGDQLIFRGILPAGAMGAPLHSHDEMTETFEVESGALTIAQANGAVRRLEQGERIVIEPGTPHGFSNPMGSETRFITTATPGAELEEFLRTLYSLAAQGRVKPDGSPSDPLAMAVALERMDMRITAIPGAVQRLLVGALAWIARRTGVADTVGAM